MYLGKDQRICCGCMPGHVDNQSSKYIPVDILCKDHHGILLCRCRCRLSIARLIHKAKDCKGHHRLVQLYTYEWVWLEGFPWGEQFGGLTRWWRCRSALCEWITDVIFRTGTCWSVVDNVA